MLRREVINKLQLWHDAIIRKIGVMCFDRPVTKLLYE